MPWFQRSEVRSFYSAISDLCDGMAKYLMFLQDQQKRTTSDHLSPDYVRSIDDVWDMHIIEGDTRNVQDSYQTLYDTLSNKNVYECICLESFGPQERYARRHWVQVLQLPFPVKVWSYGFGNNLGTIRFIWRLPINKDDRSSDSDIDIIAAIKKDIPKYATRKMKKEFIDRYSNVPGMQAAILRNIHGFLTGDASAAVSSAQAEVDERVVKFLADGADPNLFWDLRTLNGRPKDPRYENFWRELAKFLDEKSAVHERRQGDHLYLPFATSVRDLIEIIKERLPAESSIPSESWVRLNFWPTNAYSKAAVAYTGQFRVKFAVQQRLTRAQHADAKYCLQLFSYLKSMAVKWRDHIELFSLDDKAIIPVGEPKTPISTGVRAHHGSLVPVGGVLSALDHDFHLCGLVPSVAFHINIPEDPSDSFYDGKVHVTIKDKIFQPSSPVRHGAELLQLIREQKDEMGNPILMRDGLNLHVPILAVYTDGGPDHRTTYRSVQMSWIAVFLSLDLDLLIAARTAPYQSYSNPVERCMSLLNLGLQNVALSREAMEAKYEQMIKPLGTISQVRQRAVKSPVLKEHLLSSMEPVVSLLKKRFSRLRWKEESVQMHDPCEEDDMERLLETLLLLDNELDLKTVNKDKTALATFFEQHCRQRQYVFQVKKCGKCSFCNLSPPRLPDELFSELDFVPDPVLDGDRYKQFDDVYGTPTTDDDRPALKEKPGTCERDKKFKSLFVAAKARQWISCMECQKRRVIYCEKKLDRGEEMAITRAKEEVLYTCGSSLLPPAHSLYDKLVVKEGTNCETPMETTYYSASTRNFAACCFWCASVNVYEGPEVMELRKSYSVVRPICKVCIDSGKEPSVRCGIQVGVKRKK